MVEQEIMFDKRKMEVLVKEDALIRLVVRDLVGRGNEWEEALLVAFNSYILDDYTMSRVYLSL